MENLIKLPKAYYKYANIELNESDKEVKDKVVITLSIYLACKLEKYCYYHNFTNQRAMKQLLVNSKILNEDEVDLKDTMRTKYEFENIESETLKHVKANKQINIYLSKYAKDKLYKTLLEKRVELTFLIKNEMVKSEIITTEDMGY